jgi:hypothetical protein
MLGIHFQDKKLLTKMETIEPFRIIQIKLNTWQ